MAKKNTTFSEEFPDASTLEAETTATGETDATVTGETDTTLPDTGATVPADKETAVYELKDGTTGSRAAFIREKYLEDNMSRKAIAETYGFAYRVVYSATVNMANESEATSRGRSTTNANILVNAENQVVEVRTEVVAGVDGAEDTEVSVTYVNGVVVDKVYTEEELTGKSRNEWIKEVVEAGMARADVATILGLSYGVVYGLTKEAESSRTAHVITLEDGTEISRSEYIRQLLAAGKTKGDIAKELGVPYSVVWQATKVEKSAQEKYEEALKTLEGFADSIADADAFATSLAVLKELTVKTAEADASAEAAAAEAEAGTEVPAEGEVQQ